MLPKILEVELKCGFCNHFWKNTPRILECGHSICDSCCRSNITRTMLMKSDGNSNSINPHHKSLSTFHRNNHDSINEQDALSESDSGIFLSNTSNSSAASDTAFNSTMNQSGNATIKPSNRNYHISCPCCGYISIIPSQYVGNCVEYFPYNLAVNRLKQQYLEQINENDPLKVTSQSSANLLTCQLCEYNPANCAKVYCEQCQVYYCGECKEKCHPMRGPLEKHKLILVTELLNNGNANNSGTNANFKYKNNHVDIKKCKVVLSKSLQRVSEKAKSGSEFVQNLKKNFDEIKKKRCEYLDQLDKELDQMVVQIERKRTELHSFIDTEYDKKEALIKEQINEGGQIITKATSMIHMAAQLIKDSDPNHFNTISERLINRSNRVEKTIIHDLNDLQPKFRTRFEFKLDVSPIIHDINKLELFEYKAPEIPKFILDRCSVWDNLINVVWHPQGSIEVENYILEIDDGNGGSYKTAYCGPENMCTIENLHFSANYKLRIKAINSAGISASGDVIKLTTSSVANFRMYIPVGCRRNGVSLSKDGLEIESACSNNEDFVLMATTGFSKGVHYWEFLVETYDGMGEPSFGVALENCSKNKKLGTDMLSWGMYLNSKRSWFRHKSEHSGRADVHLMSGRRVGVRLDADHSRISFYLDGRIHGPAYFSIHQQVGSSRSYSHLATVSSSVSGSGSTASSSSNVSTSSVVGCITGSSQSLSENNYVCNNSTGSRTISGASSTSGTSNSSSSSSTKLLYPAVSVSHGIKLRLISGVACPAYPSSQTGEEDLTTTTTISNSNSTDSLDGGSSCNKQHNSSLEEITTPSLTRRLDVVTSSKILDGITTL